MIPSGNSIEQTVATRPHDAVAGVLIGGQSRRMGTCKALLTYRGETFLDRVVSVARSAVDEVVLLGNAKLDLADVTGLVRLEDPPNAAGPLAGLVSLLAYAGDRRTLMIACDMPLIKTEMLLRLLKACDATVDAVAYRVVGDGESDSPSNKGDSPTRHWPSAEKSMGHKPLAPIPQQAAMQKQREATRCGPSKNHERRYHVPCCVVFHPRIALEARSELTRSASLRALLGRVRARILEADDVEARCLRSVNTPEEYADLLSSNV